MKYENHMRNVLYNELIIEKKSVYGNELIYPRCETSEKFACLLNVKTFNEHQIHYIKSLGFTFKQKEMEI